MISDDPFQPQPLCDLCTLESPALLCTCPLEAPTVLSACALQENCHKGLLHAYSN